MIKRICELQFKRKRDLWGMCMCCPSSKRYAVTFNGSESIVLRSRFLSPSALTAALLSAMINAPRLPSGDRDISGATSVFTEYKNDMAWPLSYRQKVCDAINVLQFRLCLPSTTPVTRYGRDVCTIDIGTRTLFLRVSTFTGKV